MMGQQRRLWEIVAIVLFVAALASVAGRCWRLQRPADNPHHPGRTAFCDFQDVVYYPARAAMAGVNPYDARPAEQGGEYYSHVPAGNSFPLYAPLIFIASLPFAVLPLGTAELLYWLLNVAMLVLYAYLLVRLAGVPAKFGAVCGVAAAILISRPGQATFHFGSIALPLVLSSIGSWWLADRRPWLAAVLFALACIKPTFGGPLFVLLLLRGSYTTAFGGLAIAAVANIATMTVFLPHFLDTENLLELLANNQAVIEEDPAVDPLVSGSRVDTLMVVERLWGRHLPGVARMAITFAMLITAGFFLRRSARTPMASEQNWRLDSLGVALLTIGICIYHNIYDALAVGPAIVAAWSGWKNAETTNVRQWRLVALAGLLVPAVNYFSSQQFISLVGEMIPPLATVAKLPAIWTVICVLNGICLTAAWCILLSTSRDARHAAD